VIDARTSSNPRGVFRRNDSPFRIEPHRGQVSENLSKSPSNKRWRVLHEDESGSYFTNDPGHLHPESRPFSFDSFAFAGDADVLAGKAPAHHIHSASPRPGVESKDVIPDGEAREDPVTLALEQDASAAGVDLDSADAGMSQKVAAEDSSPCSSK